MTSDCKPVTDSKTHGRLRPSVESQLNNGNIYYRESGAYYVVSAESMYLKLETLVIDDSMETEPHNSRGLHHSATGNKCKSERVC